MGCGGSKDANLSIETRNFLEVFNSKPDFSKYGKNTTNIKTIEKSLASPIYGGSAILPIGKKDKRTRER